MQQGVERHIGGIAEAAGVFCEIAIALRFGPEVQVMTWSSAVRVTMFL